MQNARGTRASVNDESELILLIHACACRLRHVFIIHRSSFNELYLDRLSWGHHLGLAAGFGFDSFGPGFAILGDGGPGVVVARNGQLGLDQPDGLQRVIRSHSIIIANGCYK